MITATQLHGKKILFLQGPMGFFFKKLDDLFRKHESETSRIALNAGDYLYANKDNLTCYKGTKEGWQRYIHDYLADNGTDILFLFGDCRFYHSEAIKAAAELNVNVFVFEEGYIRPAYVTVERDGVNAYGNIPAERSFYDQMTKVKIPPVNSCDASDSYRKMAFQAAGYYAMMRIFRWLYPHYEHHREMSPYVEIFWGIRSGLRKQLYKFSERKYASLLSGELSRKYYFVPLQTRNDFQCTVHSDFDTIERFIRKTIGSFSQNAPAETSLVFKHHPMDRGINSYKKYIRNLCREYDIEGRVHYVHDVHLPTCLKHSIGTITINSTVGISSLYHRIPTITLGKAFYDIEGLTCRNMDLDHFWRGYIKPDNKLFTKFRHHVINTTQLRGSFYTGFPEELSLVADIMYDAEVIRIDSAA